MKYLFGFILLFSILACSKAQKKFLPESTVLKIHEKKYDSLRKSLKDSLALGINNVNDYNHIFQFEEKVYLDSLINEHKTKTGIQLVIITFDSLMSSKDSVEEVTRIVGIKNQINTTIGISFPNKSMTIWSDSLINNTIFAEYEAEYVIDNKFFPLFKKGEYFKGTVEGLKAIIQRMNSNRYFQEFPSNGH